MNYILEFNFEMFIGIEWSFYYLLQMEDVQRWLAGICFLQWGITFNFCSKTFFVDSVLIVSCDNNTD